MSDIKYRLESSHRHICSAGGEIGTLLVKRRLWKSNVKSAVIELEEALKLLRPLVSGEIDDR